ncbi:MAG: PilZ domain-containing protein [Acidobacteriia bacterium]|nr:PilZ domain-containing protein [Terriglobia bacterium]
MSDNSPLSDRRSNPRIPVNLALRYGTNDELITGELVDVSAGGIGIVGETAYPAGTELVLRFRSRNSKTDLLSLRAVVRHTHGKRMGLEFVNLPISDFARTLAMIERLTGNQEKLVSA